MFGFKRTQGGDQIVDRAVTFEQVHVFHPTEAPLQGGGKNNDRHFRPAPAKDTGHFRTELTCSQMVVEDSDIDFVEQLLRLGDGAGGIGQVTVLTQYGGAKQQVFRIIIEQQHTNRIFDQMQTLPSPFPR